MRKLRFAVMGCGFWANYQIPAWMELDGVELVALYNRTRAKADVLARQYNVPATYDDAALLLDQERLDFVDIITDVDTHPIFTQMAAERGITVICQKPMAPNLAKANTMVEVCKQNGVPFYIHENFRWQYPIRKAKEALESGVVGNPFKARITFCSAFPVFDNQPALGELEHFILTDIGSHILDICRFLFGEAETIYCQTARVNQKIKGEDVANVLMKMQSGLHCYAEMSYASILEKEAFPQTLLLIEGEKGSVHVSHDYVLTITTKEGTTKAVVQPVHYDWADKDYDVVHSSIVDCNRNILQALQGTGKVETTGDDNLKTVKLVWAAYESARENRVVKMNDFV